MDSSTIRSSGRGDATALTSRRTFLRIAGTAAGAGLAASPAAGNTDTAVESTTIGVTPAHEDLVTGTVGTLERQSASAISIEVLDTTVGFEEFGTGPLDVLLGNRPIMAKERSQTLAHDVEYESREVPTAMASLVQPTTAWLDPLRPAQLAETWATDGPVETWAELQDDAAETPDPRRRVPDDGPTLVRGVRSSQYATGFGGVGYYEPDQEWFSDRPQATNEDGTSTTLVRLSYLYADEEALAGRPATEFVQTYLRDRNAVFSEVPYYGDPVGK